MNDKYQAILGVLASLAALLGVIYTLDEATTTQLITSVTGIATGIFSIYKIFSKK